MSVDPRILTTITAVIDVLAAIVYTVQCGTAELRMVVYWLAAVLTFVVTW